MFNPFRGIHFYRHFLSLLVKKEFKKRYTQSFLGMAWMVLEPLILVGSLSIIFTLLGRKGPNGLPFPVFFYSGILFWNMFSRALGDGPNAFVKDKSLMQKTNFPKQISIFRALSVYIVEMSFSLISFSLILLYYGVTPKLSWLYLPVLFFILLVLCFSLILLLASLNVYIRDIGILSRSIASVWFWLTPVIFIFPENSKAAILYYINPVAGIIANVRNTMFFDLPVNWSYMICAFVWTIVLFLVGGRMYKRLEGRFVDAM